MKLLLIPAAVALLLSFPAEAQMLRGQWGEGRAGTMEACKRQLFRRMDRLGISLLERRGVEVDSKVAYGMEIIMPDGCGFYRVTCEWVNTNCDVSTTEVANACDANNVTPNVTFIEGDGDCGVDDPAAPLEYWQKK